MRTLQEQRSWEHLKDGLSGAGGNIDSDAISNHSSVPIGVTSKFEVFDWRNAIAILNAVRVEEWLDILDVLTNFSLDHSQIAKSGGNKSAIAKQIDEGLKSRGWVEKGFNTQIVVDGVASDSPTHAIDCYKNRVALEMEWNNKDPFFDRDLNNFRLLYDLRVIDVGVIVTRTTALERTLAKAGRSNTTYSKATTHTEKLYPKIRGGGAGGCPVVVFGIKPEAYRDDRPSD